VILQSVCKMETPLSRWWFGIKQPSDEFYCNLWPKLTSLEIKLHNREDLESNNVLLGKSDDLWSSQDQTSLKMPPFHTSQKDGCLLKEGNETPQPRNSQQILLIRLLKFWGRTYGFQQKCARLLHSTQVENQLVLSDPEVTLECPQHWIKLINGNFLEPKFQISIEQIHRNNNGIPNGDLNGKENHFWSNCLNRNIQKPSSKRLRILEIVHEYDGHGLHFRD